jgi:hypothetical protein
MADTERDPYVEELIARLQMTGAAAERLRRNVARGMVPTGPAEQAPPPPPVEAAPIRATLGPRLDPMFGLTQYTDDEPLVPPRAPIEPPETPADKKRKAAGEALPPRRRRKEQSAYDAEYSSPDYDPDLDFGDAPTAQDDQRVYEPAATMLRFHESNKKVRALLGPVGSGKSTTCCIEILSRAMRVPPLGEKKVRHSRWLVARATYAELKSTTITTFRYWLGHLGKFRFGSPITFEAKQALPDGTTMHLEVVFLPLDTEDAVKRLRSLEITGAWLNEGSLIEANHITEILGRLRFRGNDYPQNRQPWRGIIIDSNMPNRRHWLYEVFELDPPGNHELFIQPPALLRRPDGGYDPNPDAENIDHLPDGYQYYYDMADSKDEKVRRKIAVLVLGEYGSLFTGKPVYDSTWSSRIHVAPSPLEPVRHLPLIIGMDWGLNPAAVYTQESGYGGISALDEDCPLDLTLEAFLSDYVMPKIARRFAGMRIEVIGDPSGVNRSAFAQKNGFQIVRSFGLSVTAAYSNDLQSRRDAVSYYLTRTGKFAVDKARCPVLIEGFEGGYRFKQRAGGGGYSEEPDKTHPISDVHDALQYAAMRHYRPFAEAMARGRAASVHSVQQRVVSGEGTEAVFAASGQKRGFFYG